MSHGEDIELPAPVWDAFQEKGLRRLKGGDWRLKGERWFLSVIRAPQSWERMLSPLLAEAILEARVGAQKAKAKPLAVLVAPNLSEAMHERLSAFALRVAPKDSWIAADVHGRVFFHLPSGVDFKAPPPSRDGSSPAKPRREANLFSDLHQWMLKVLLAPNFEEHLLKAPRRSIRNARVLAEVAGVSVPAAARFVSALEKAGHLDRRFGDLRIAEPKRLLERWRGAIPVSYRQELGARFVRGAPDEMEFGLLMSIAGAHGLGKDWKLALGLFEACRALKLGHSRGGPRHLYVSSYDSNELEALGLVAAAEGERADIVLRIPKFPEALFRAAPVVRGGLVADVIQCWLDVSHHPARGEEQADFLWRRAIAPALRSDE